MKSLIAFLILSFILLNNHSGYAQIYSQDTVNASSPDSGNCILNYHALFSFFEKLSSSADSVKKATVLHLGDSHIQMGYFAGEMRRNLSAQFGYSSLGMLFPHPLAGYRPFYVNAYATKGQWVGSNILKSESFIQHGVAGFSIQTKNKKAEFTVFPQKIENQIQQGDQVILYYSGATTSRIYLEGVSKDSDSTLRIRPVRVDSTAMTMPSEKWKKIIFDFSAPIHKLIFTVEQEKDSVPFNIYSVQLLNRNQSGIVYHNCGVGGSTFISLCKNASLSQEQIKDLKPDLIIFSFGSNEAYTKAFKAEEYYQNILKYINSIKINLPNTSVLLTTPPDTRSKDRYPVNIDSICFILKKIAEERGLAFWDLRHSMGGNGSLHKWLQLGLASKDKLHFTKAGYELQAQLLTEAIFQEYNKYVAEDKKIPIPVYRNDFK